MVAGLETTGADVGGGTTGLPTRMPHGIKRINFFFTKKHCNRFSLWENYKTTMENLKQKSESVPQT